MTVRPKGTIVGPAVATAAAFAMLMLLGTWQLERKAWKEDLIATLERRLSAAPAALPSASRWSGLAAAQDEFRRVAFVAELLNGAETLVYSPGSSLRRDITGPGYRVFTPGRLTDGSLVMVDRGFVPGDRKDAASRPEGQLGGRTDLVGVLRWPESAGLFTPAADPKANLWFVRDPAGMAAAKGIGPVAPFYIELESPVPPGGLPRPGHLRANLPNNHLGYAITWYGLALALLAVFAAWAAGRRREARPRPDAA